PLIPNGGIRNAASFAIYAIGAVTFGGTIKENDEVTVTIGTKEYKYKIVKDDTFAKVVDTLVASINEGAGDPNVLATANAAVQGILLTSRLPGDAGNAVTIAATGSAGATITATASGVRLAGGG